MRTTDIYSDDIILDMIDNLRIGLGHRYIPHPRDYVFTVNNREFRYYCKKLQLGLEKLNSGNIVWDIRNKFKNDMKKL